MAELKLTYGKKQDGLLVHVDDVLRGMACNCTCPGCGAPLIARKGEKKQHHFAHANGADCAGARMTALHTLAQQIIQDERKIRTPRFKEYYENPSNLIRFESVLLEQRFKTAEINRRPDCVGIFKMGDKQYEVWIEIKVKHAIDEEKKKDIERLRAICMEIDLSNLLDKEYTKDSVRHALFDEYDNKEWINYPALFKKNEEEWRKSKEFEEYQQEKLLEEERELNVFVGNWMTYGRCEDAEKIIDIIKNNPYNTPPKSVCKIIDILVPEDNIIDWLKDTPKNTYTKKLFYCILNYYTPQLYDNLDRKIVDEKLNSFRFKQFVTEQEKIEIELLISLKIVSTLRYQYHPYPYVYYFDEKKELYKKYISDEVFRNKCLKLLSIEYRHIVGSESKDFLTLTEEITRFYRSILPLYIAILVYTNTTKRPKFDIPSLEDEQIVGAKKIVDSIIVDEDCYQLFDSVFGYLIKNSTFKRKRIIHLEPKKTEDTQSQIDFLDSKDMSFEEQVEGFAKLNELFNQKQH